jgi:hypothetical protein
MVWLNPRIGIPIHIVKIRIHHNEKEFTLIRFSPNSPHTSDIGMRPCIGKRFDMRLKKRGNAGLLGILDGIDFVFHFVKPP